MPPSPTTASPDPPASPGSFVSDRPPASPQEGGASDSAGRLARILGRCVAPVYALGARLDRAWGRRRRAARGRPACAVVSVGGLTVGGAGKTPMAAWLARSLADRGHRVVIASRGYRGRRDEAVTVVSDGLHVLGRVEEVGDEAMVLAARAAGVPVLVGADRLRVGHAAVTLFDAQILVLDDGFQHHRLARDFDLVCVDARAGIGNGRVLPAGPLREPLSALRDADALCWLGVVADPPAPLPPRLRRALPPDRAVHRGWRHALDLVPLGAGRPHDPAALASLRGARVGLVSGLARPAGFRALVESLGAVVVRELRFPDHHAYGREDLQPVRASVATALEVTDRSADAAGGSPGATLGAPTRWLTTEKDAYKILCDWIGSARVDVLRIGLQIEEADSLLEGIEERLRACGRLD